MKIILKVLSKTILYTCAIVVANTLFTYYTMTFNIYIASIIALIVISSVMYDFYKMSSHDYLESKNKKEVFNER